MTAMRRRRTTLETILGMNSGKSLKYQKRLVYQPTIHKLKTHYSHSSLSHESALHRKLTPHHQKHRLILRPFRMLHQITDSKLSTCPGKPIKVRTQQNQCHIVYSQLPLPASNPLKTPNLTATSPPQEEKE